MYKAPVYGSSELVSIHRVIESQNYAITITLSINCAINSKTIVTCCHSYTSRLNKWHQYSNISFTTWLHNKYITTELTQTTHPNNMMTGTVKWKTKTLKWKTVKAHSIRKLRERSQFQLKQYMPVYMLILCQHSSCETTSRHTLDKYS